MCVAENYQTKTFSCFAQWENINLKYVPPYKWTQVTIRQFRPSIQALIFKRALLCFDKKL